MQTSPGQGKYARTSPGQGKYVIVSYKAFKVDDSKKFYWFKGHALTCS